MEDIIIDYEECKHLFSVHHVVREMLVDRGFEIPVEYFIDDMDMFSALHSSKDLDMYVEDTEKNIGNYVHFHSKNKNFGKNDLITIVQSVHHLHSNVNSIHIDIIIKEDKTNAAVKKLLTTDKDYQDITIFPEKRLRFNYVRNKHQPDFELLDNEKRAKFIETYKITSAEIPKMLTSDPVARYYNAKSGDIFRIVGISETQKDRISYRIVR